MGKFWRNGRSGLPVSCRLVEVLQDVTAMVGAGKGLADGDSHKG